MKYECGLPLSYLVIGTSAMPLNKVGIPITIPEKVAFPPRYSVYLLEEEIMMKNESFRGTFVTPYNHVLACATAYLQHCVVGNYNDQRSHFWELELFAQLVTARNLNIPLEQTSTCSS